MPAKGLKFIVDVGVGKKAESWLQAQGYDIKCIRDINPRMTDSDILMMAVFR